MTDQDFLWAILAEPDDDLPRLAYADWLDEQGQGERAEFIRIQCRLPCIGFMADGTVRTGCPEDDREEMRLRRRERELLAIPVSSRPDGDVNCAEGWSGGTTAIQWGIAAFNRLTRTGFLYGDRLQWEWRRGFVARVACTEDDWEQHGPAIVAAQPVETVRLTNKEPYWNGGGYVYYNAERERANHDVPPSAVLPPELFGLLSFLDAPPVTARFHSFSCVNDANSWLAFRCIRWAREQAAQAKPPLVPEAVAEAWGVKVKEPA